MSVSEEKQGTEAAIICTDLGFSYGVGNVLSEVNFTVPKSGITALLGKNGAGKSTIINILMGFLSPQRGFCRVLGYPGHAIPPRVRRDIGLIHEGFIQFDYMSLAEIERFYSSFYPRWNSNWYYSLIERLDVPLNRRVSKMSCGQRSQVALGLILAQEPRLMILDDYSLGLDVGYRRLFLELLRDYIDKTHAAAFLTSHVVRELDAVADNVIVISKGRIIASAARADFIDSVRQYHFPLNDLSLSLSVGGVILGLERHTSHIAVYTVHDEESFAAGLITKGFSPDCLNLKSVPMDLEDAFIGLTGRY